MYYSKISFFKEIDILILPSKREGFGIVCIEAQSVGAFLVPKGTSAQRPSSPSEGQVRYNTTNRHKRYKTRNIK